ncbi:MAG TPA: hypothetical protein PK398_02360 [Candidatus Gracilibacteria bacterium]|nr:hypothetical protein [Candidatus Gracilibacteria bacterium]
MKKTDKNIKSIKELQEMVDGFFLVSPSMKKELKETLGLVDAEGLKVFAEYIESVLEKQNQVLDFILKYNKGFLEELKILAEVNSKNAMKKIEAKVAIDEKKEMEGMEAMLQTI